jgi:beta-glucuronidase
MKNIFVLLLLLPFFLAAQPYGKKTLNGEWSFALDPVSVGQKQQWYNYTSSPKGWDKVNVPHSFSVDKRYHNFTGDVWYIRPVQMESLPKGFRAFLRFEAVFYKCKVWLNGTELGEHEGGYTPFEFDITGIAKEENTISVMVNNAWDTTTIPGAKTKIDYQTSNIAQVYPWINYGGITRNVSVIIRPDVYFDKLKILAEPDLPSNTARIEIMALVRNSSGSIAEKQEVRVNLYQAGKKVRANYKVEKKDIPSDKDVTFKISMVLNRDVKLWSFDTPELYEAEGICGKDTVKQKFGVRSVKILSTQLLVNGEPVRMGGCNRPLDYPEFGSMDPKSVLEKDLTLIKNGSMELSRISHYPVSVELLDWADEHGMLLILEAGNWQMTPQQMSDPVMREKFKNQFREMIERDWNHPSVIAWSVGNEYQSGTPEGQSWTKDMVAYARELDPSRLVTFASYIVFRDNITKPEDEASQYVDFISANIYGNHLKHLQHIHELFPDKPVFVSEFGMRADHVKDEQERVQYLMKTVAEFRKCNFLIGASIWTFNDYQSYFPGTNIDGYRHWGLVNADRQLRDMYLTWQEEFSPATIQAVDVAGKLKISVLARADFPSYILRNYHLRINGNAFSLGILKPGETIVIPDEISPVIGGREIVIELVKPGDFVILKKVFSRNGGNAELK